MGLWYQSQFHLWGPIKGHLGSYQNTWSGCHFHLLTEFLQTLWKVKVKTQNLYRQQDHQVSSSAIPGSLPRSSNAHPAQISRPMRSKARAGWPIRRERGMRGSRNSPDSLGLAAFRTLVANDVDEEVYIFWFICDLQISVSIFAIWILKTHAEIFCTSWQR